MNLNERKRPVSILDEVEKSLKRKEEDLKLADSVAEFEKYARSRSKIKHSTARAYKKGT
jgi:hypothetical protein